MGNREKWTNRVKRKNELKTHVICELPSWILHFVCLSQLLTSDVFELHYKVCVLGLRPNPNIKFHAERQSLFVRTFPLFSFSSSIEYCFGIFYLNFFAPFWFQNLEAYSSHLNIGIYSCVMPHAHFDKRQNENHQLRLLLDLLDFFISNWFVRLAASFRKLLSTNSSTACSFWFLLLFHWQCN